jgi:copper chaperone CopZ
MTVATKSNHTIEIDGMTGEDCCKKVTSALEGVSNVETHQVKVGSAKIEADHAGCTAACKAIDNAGFKAHENEKKDQPGGQKHDSQQRGSTDGKQMGARSESNMQPKGEQKSHTPGGAASKSGSGTR